MLHRRDFTRLALLAVAAPLPAPEPRHAAEEERVRAAVHRFFTLSETRDWDAVGRLLSEGFAIYTDQAAAFSKAEYVDLLDREEGAHVATGRVERAGIEDKSVNRHKLSVKICVSLQESP